MENFTYENPTKIIFGKDTIALTGTVIKTYGYKKVLLLAGQGSIKKNGVYKTVAKSLKASGIRVAEVWGVRPNPLLSKVNEAIKIAKAKKVQAIIAVGGGSVIDSAKAVAAGVYVRNIWDVFEDKVRVVKALPIFAVLTVSGTASEMNQWAVVTHDEQKKKWAMGADALFPQVSIIDPRVQMSLPWKQTVYGAMDAIAHLMENYFMGTDQEVSLAMNEALMRTIMNMLDRLQKNPKDYNARANLVWAAGIAHAGLFAAAMHGGDWGSHGIQHGIGALHPESAHGGGLAVVFPAWMTYVQKSNPAIFKRWSKNVMQSPNLASAIKKFRGHLKKWRAPVYLSDLGIDKKEIKAIAQNAALQAPLGNLKKLGLKDIKAILKLTTN